MFNNAVENETLGRTGGLDHCLPGPFLAPHLLLGFPVAQLVKNLPAMWAAWVRPLGWDDPLEKGKAPHPSVLAWRILGTVSSMGSQRAGHDGDFHSNTKQRSTNSLSFLKSRHMSKNCDF